jgi:Na+-driven multidrug efflux pump
VAAALALRQLCRSDNAARLDFRQIRFQREDLRGMVRLGVPMGISGVLYSISNIAIQSTVNSLGTDIIAGWSVHVKVDTVIWSLYDAFGIAASTFAAQNYGAGKYDRVRAGVRSSLAVGTVVIVPLCVLMYAFIRPLSQLFVDDAAVTEYAVRIARIMAPYYIFYLFGDVFAASIRGCGEVVKPMLLTLIGTCGFRLLWVAMIHIFGGPTLLNVALSYPASWFFNSLLVSLYFFFGKWRSRLEARP